MEGICSPKKSVLPRGWFCTDIFSFPISTCTCSFQEFSRLNRSTCTALERISQFESSSRLLYSMKCESQLRRKDGVVGKVNWVPQTTNKCLEINASSVLPSMGRWDSLESLGRWTSLPSALQQYIYIYIYIYREREKEICHWKDLPQHLLHITAYIRSLMTSQYPARSFNQDCLHRPSIQSLTPTFAKGVTKR